MAETSSEDPELLTIALNHAWAWYEASFGHRLQLVNFFFFVLAGDVAGYIAALQATLNVVAGGVALVGVLTTVALARLARRARERIEAAALPLGVLQERLAVLVEVDELRMIARVTAPRPRRQTTVWIATVVYRGLAMAFLAASCYGFLRAWA